MLKELLEDAVKKDEEEHKGTPENKDDAKKRRERFMNLLNEKMADND